MRPHHDQAAPQAAKPIYFAVDLWRQEAGQKVGVSFYKGPTMKVEEVKEGLMMEWNRMVEREGEFPHMAVKAGDQILWVNGKQRGEASNELKTALELLITIKRNQCT